MKKIAALASAAAFLSLFGCSGSSGGGDDPAKVKADFDRACTTCHGAEMALTKNKTQEEWTSTVSRMRVKGAPVSQEEGEKIARWLYAQRPK